MFVDPWPSSFYASNKNIRGRKKLFFVTAEDING
jgi:hypothetical protein